MRTRSRNTRNYFIDFIVTTISVCIAFGILSYYKDKNALENKAAKLEENITFLRGEVALTTNSIEKTIDGLKLNLKTSADLIGSLNEKKSKAIDSLSGVIYNFDVNVTYLPELSGFLAFESGEEINDIQPLSTRKQLLKHLNLLEQSITNYNNYLNSEINIFIELKASNFSESGTVKNRYRFYSGGITTLFENYTATTKKQLKYLQRVKQSFSELDSSLLQITSSLTEDEDED